MKKKITRIWGIGLVVILVTSLLLSAAPVSAKELSWGTEGTPGTTGLKILSETGANLGDVTDFDIGPDGLTIWAASTENNKLYKSTDGGWTWSSKTLPTGLTTPQGVAVAPDDESFVAVYGDGTEVYVTTNGGTSWGSLGTVQETAKDAAVALTDIDVSAEDSSKHYVAVSGTDAGAVAPLGVGNVWYFDVGSAAPKWIELNSLGGFGAPATTNMVRAIAFSPNFASDFIMLALTVDPGVAAHYQMFSFNQKLWNGTAGFTSYPVIVYAGVTTMAAGGIGMAPDYLGSDDSMRIAFVAMDVDIALGDGIYRLKDNSLKGIKTGSGSDAGSVAFDGTNLITGQAGAGSAIWRSDDPLASSPTFSTTSSLKRPGGATNPIVAWNGADVLVGTRGNESCFGLSEDNGKSFNAISLIDHPIGDGAFEDMAVSEDGEVLYLITNDGADMRVWRKASEWQSVLSVTGNVNFIIRLSPDDSDVVYVADVGAKTIYFSSEGGDTKWFQRAARYNVQDLALEGDDVLYAAVAGDDEVSKSTNGGFTWASSKSCSFAGGTNVWMLRSLGEDMLIASNNQGYVSYSDDGNSSWTKIKKQLNGALMASVTASGLSDGDFVYAATFATNTLVERWELGESTSWKDMGAGVGAAVGAVPATLQVATGIELVDNTLYVATNDAGATNSIIYRSINPTGSSPAWQTAASSAAGGEIFGLSTSPDGLYVSEGSVKLWVIDTSPGAGTDDEIWTYTDTISAGVSGPSQASPGDGADVKVNPVSGGTYTVSFTWDRLSKSTMYDFQVALDSDFDELVVSQTGIPAAGTTSATVANVVAGAAFMPDTTYYWRVRVNSAGPLRSSWSEVRSFNIGDLPEAQAPVIIEQPPAPVIEVPPAPEIILQPPDIILPAPTPAPEIVIPAAPAPAPAVPQWALLVIIIIGAVLVIALIVLIMRTRRPV